MKFYTHLDRTKCSLRACQFSARVRRRGQAADREASSCNAPQLPRFLVYLFRPPGPAAAGRVGLYILLLCFFFFFFDNRCYSHESAKQAAGYTIPTVGLPAELIKYLQTFDPCCPHFLQRGQNGPNFGPNFDPDRLWTAVFVKAALYRKSKTNLSRINDSSTTTPNLGSGGCLLYTSDAADE